MNTNKPRAFIVTNIDVFFLTNRKEQAQIMQELGYEIHVLAADTGRSAEITGLGFIFHELPLGRFGLGPLSIISNIFKIRKIYRDVNPAVIHQLGLKIILLGTLAGLGTKAIIFNTYTGLGYLFTINNLKTGVLRRILIVMLKMIYKNKRVIAIFQNNTDYNLFKKYGIINEENGYVIRGCGVDMKNFALTPFPEGDIVRVLLPGKMLSSKGIYEFVEVSRIIRGEKGLKHVEFVLCGGIDAGHPFSIQESQLLEWQEQGWIKWLGNQRNMTKVYQEADIVVLPSWREGLPKSLLEAGAVGRPIITYDVAGCNEVVLDNHNGYIVPFKDTAMMAERLQRLIEDRELRQRMGENSYEYVKEHFELYKIIDENIGIYNKYIHVSKV